MMAAISCGVSERLRTEKLLYFCVHERGRKGSQEDRQAYSGHPPHISYKELTSIPVTLTAMYAGIGTFAGERKIMLRNSGVSGFHGKEDRCRRKMHV